MEASLRRDSSSSPVLADLAAPQGCDTEFSRSESQSESEIDSSSSVENSIARLHEIEDSEKQGWHAAWTNEKHNQYLDHLESSFIEQLQQSSGILDWCSEHDPDGPYLSQKLHAKQMKVVQDGCSDNIDVKRKQHILNHATGSLFVLKSHTSCASRRFSRTTKLQNNSVARNEKSLDYIREFSDQNFADEANEHISKRSKTITLKLSSKNARLYPNARFN